MDNEIKKIQIEKLLLDEENPRLPESVERNQQNMLDFISETTSIEELMDAIAENDYFPGEPLIVVPSKKDQDKYIVVEGNRRLTALKLLQNARACSNPSIRMKEISDKARFKPESIPVIIRPERSDVIPYLGFRHITGVKQWEPLAKARYIEQLFNLTSKSDAPKDRYLSVARAIGSRRDHIKRNLDALAVYKIIKEKDFYEIEGLDDESIKFSVLSTALADERIGSFVGVSQRDDQGVYQQQDPIINEERLDSKAISELTHWLFEKDSKGKTKVGESRNLRYLAAVVDNSRALNAFRSNSPLTIAYQFTSDLSKDFLELLYTVDGYLTEASGMVATIEFDDDAYQVARRILENIKLIGRTLREKQRSDENEF